MILKFWTTFRLTNTKCYLFCESFVEEKCDFLSKPPYVCDGCTKSHNCALEKVYYIPIQAHEEAKLDW